jgi:hypothetical protein
MPDVPGYRPRHRSDGPADPQPTGNRRPWQPKHRFPVCGPRCACALCHSDGVGAWAACRREAFDRECSAAQGFWHGLAGPFPTRAEAERYAVSGHGSADDVYECCALGHIVP